MFYVYVDHGCELLKKDTTLRFVLRNRITGRYCGFYMVYLSKSVKIMGRYWDISLIICFSVMFGGAENLSDQLPPPKNLNFIWETPFTLYVKWEKPEGLNPDCEVNYTVNVYQNQTCQGEAQSRRISNLNYRFNVANVNGTCITVTTLLLYPEKCGNKPHSPASSISIPPPAVMLVRNFECWYPSKKIKCTWSPDGDVQGLTFYYWLSMNESVKECSSYINKTTGMTVCDIYSEHLKDSSNYMFYMFKGTHKGIHVNNTFRMNCPRDLVKLNKPKVKIVLVGEQLFFQTIRSNFEQFPEHCFSYNYTYSKCNEEFTVIGTMNYSVDYNSACKYKAKVKITFIDTCGSGASEAWSDEETYGDNSDPNLPMLLAIIIIPLIVSCCLIACLVLLRRHKDDILPKIPEPSLFFKDMFSNNIRTTEDLTSPAVGRLYVPIEETVESNVSFVPETTFLHKGQ